MASSTRVALKQGLGGYSVDCLSDVACFNKELESLIVEDTLGIKGKQHCGLVSYYGYNFPSKISSSPSCR